MNSILLQSLSKKFGKGKNAKTVLSNLNLSISQGNLFALLGENGAGKTTLIKILCTLVLPDGGRAIVNGYDVEKEPARVRASIGLITSDERSFFWRLSALENLLFFATLQNMRGKSVRARIEEVIHLVGLDEAKDKPFRTYSSGMKQRLTIARGLVHNPPILLMDEPTKGLDPVKIDELRRFIRETLIKKENKTILLTTHDLKEAEEISDEVAILHKGEIKFQTKMDNSHTYDSLKQKFLEIVGVENV